MTVPPASSDLRDANLCKDSYEEGGHSLQQQGFIPVHVQDLLCFVRPATPAAPVNEVVIRGTFCAPGQEERALQNWLRNVSHSLVSFSESESTKVHQGFYGAYKLLAERFREYLVAEFPVRFVGHSLGGAIVTIAAADFKLCGHEVDGVWTAGAPRVGNGGFKELYHSLGLAAKTRRFANELDPVPRVPPEVEATDGFLGILLPGGYQHVCETTNKGVSMELWVNQISKAAHFRSARRVACAVVENHLMPAYISMLQVSGSPALNAAAALVRCAVNFKSDDEHAAGTGQAASVPVQHTLGALAQYLPVVTGVVSAATGIVTVAKVWELGRKINQLQLELDRKEARMGEAMEQFHTSLLERIGSSEKMILNGVEVILQCAERDRLLQKLRTLSAKVKEDVMLVKNGDAEDQHGLHRALLDNLRNLRGAIDAVLAYIQSRLEAVMDEPAPDATLLASLAKLLTEVLEKAYVQVVTTVSHSGLGMRTLQVSSMHDGFKIARILGQLHWLLQADANGAPWDGLATQSRRLLELLMGIAMGAGDSVKVIDALPEEASAFDWCLVGLGLAPQSAEPRLDALLQLHSEGKQLERGLRPALRWLEGLADAGAAAGRKAAVANHALGVLWGLRQDAESLEEGACGVVRLAHALRGGAMLRVPPMAKLDWHAVYLQARYQLTGATIDRCLRDELWALQLHLIQEGLVSTEADVALMEPLMQQVRTTRDKLATLLSTALDITSSLDDKGNVEKIQQIQAEADKNDEDAQSSPMCLILAGLVSSGKTTLVNALLALLLPEMQRELALKNGKGLLPSDYCENTAILTILDLDPSRPDIELDLQTASGDAGPVSQPEWPKTFAASGQYRAVQREVKKVVENKDLKQGQAQMAIKLPAPGLKERLCFVDLPGLDSKDVWHQVSRVLQSKAFLPIWVGSVMGASEFGNQGWEIMKLLQTTGQLLPPVLALTHWDKLARDEDDFASEEEKAAHVQKKLKLLKQGLQGDMKSREQELRFDDVDELQHFVQLLERGEGGQWVTKAATMTGDLTIPEGSELLRVIGPDGDEAQAGLEYPLAWRVPLIVHLKEPTLGLPLLHVATDAKHFLKDGRGGNIPELWAELQKLLLGLSMPIRLSKGLSVIENSVQEAMNVLLKDEEKASIFKMTPQELHRKHQQVVDRFRQGVEQYFANMPDNPDSLARYSPPVGFSRSCATCQLERFITIAGEEESQVLEHVPRGRRHSEYCHRVSQRVLQLWNEQLQKDLQTWSKTCMFEECSVLFERGTSKRITQLTTKLTTTDAWVGLIVVPAGAGTLCGGSSAAIAVAFFPLHAAAAPAVAAALVGAVFVGTAAYMLTLVLDDPDVQKARGTWDRKRAGREVLQCILKVLCSEKEQMELKNRLVTHYSKELHETLYRFASFRSPEAVETPEAKQACCIKQEVECLRRRLEQALLSFVQKNVRKAGGWLAPPPEDLQRALARDVPLYKDA